MNELSFEQKSKLVELRNGFFHSYCNKLFISNTLLIIFNLMMRLNNILLGVISIFICIFSIGFLLYNYRLSFQQFDLYAEDSEKLEKKAVWFGTQSWYLFCTGATFSCLNFAITIF